MYNFFKYLMKLLFLPIFKIQIIGKENIPEDGAYVVVANHKSNFDPIIISFITKRPIHFMAKAELHNTKFKQWLFEGVKTIKVDRNKNDISAIKNALKVLKNGGILGIFPEGTRIKEGAIDKNAKSGAVMLAHKSKVNILPIAMDANYKIFSKVTVNILPIFEVEKYVEQDMSYEEISMILMNNIYEWSEDH